MEKQPSPPLRKPGPQQDKRPHFVFTVAILAGLIGLTSLSQRWTRMRLFPCGGARFGRHAVQTPAICTF